MVDAPGLRSPAAPEMWARAVILLPFTTVLLLLLTPALAEKNRFCKYLHVVLLLNIRSEVFGDSVAVALKIN